MTQHKVFTKKHIEEVTQAKQTLLDELNLPPKATTFIRNNKYTLLTLFALVILSIVGRSYYIHYTTTKINKSSAALAQALAVQDENARISALRAVIDGHAGTGAASFATISLAREYIAGKQYSDAITALQAEISRLKADAPGLVLCKLLLAHAYEENGQNEPALTFYKDIGEIHEFMVVGMMGVARILEKMGRSNEAVEAYERAITSPGLSQPEKDWLQDRIRHLSVT